MPANSRRAILRLVVLLAAIACGIYGAMRMRDAPSEPVLQLLDYAMTLTVTAEQAAREAQRLIDEGQIEEAYRPRDEVFNAELDWRDSKDRLRPNLSAGAYERLDAIDLVSDGPALRRALTDVRADMTSSLPAAASLTAAGLLMLSVLALRPPGRQSAAVEPAAS
jgi:hypothetical protein